MIDALVTLILSDTEFEQILRVPLESQVILFHEFMQIFVIEVIPYVALLKRGRYKQSALLNLV